MTDVQPPNSALLDLVLERAGDELADHEFARVGAYVESAWALLADAEPHDRAKMMSLALLFNAARIRQADPRSLVADTFDRVAEAFTLSWADEVTVRKTLLDLGWDLSS